MKFFVKILVIASVGYLAQLFFPFWVLALVALFTSLVLTTHHATSFFAGLIAGFALWFLTAYISDSQSGAIIGPKISSIFGMSTLMLMIVTGLLGSLIAGFGSLTGSLLTSLFAQKQSGPYYS